MKIKKSLQPVALALPGLLATSLQAGFQHPDIYPNPATSTWQGSYNLTTGYTGAAYSGAATTIVGQNWGYDINLGCQAGNPQTFNNVTAASMSATWSSNTYSQGHSQVTDNSTGQADGWVYNGTKKNC